MHDVTVHQTDILLSWFGREPSLVFANQTRKTEAGSVLAATLVFDDGTNGTIRDDFASELRRSWPMTMVGELGSLDGTDDIEIPEAGQPRMERGYLRVGIHRQPGVSVDIPLVYRYAPESSPRPWATSCSRSSSDDEPWASGENVLKTMRTLFAIERSIATVSRSRPPPSCRSEGFRRTRRVMAIDVGTTAVKAAVLDGSAVVLSTGTAAQRTISDERRTPRACAERDLACRRAGGPPRARRRPATARRHTGRSASPVRAGRSPSSGQTVDRGRTP